MTQAQQTSGHQHFLTLLAQRIIEDNRDNLPDLSHLYIFIPNALAAHQLRRHLTRQAQTAMIGPYIGSLQQWVNENIALEPATTTVINQQAQRLLMLEALGQHTDLFNPENTWQVCDSLLTLFNELTQNSCTALAKTEQLWLSQLQAAYGSGDTTLTHLNYEANIVHTLWQAWHEQNQARNILDEASAYHKRLLGQAKNIHDKQLFYIIGPEQLTPAELSWCQNLSATQTVHYISQNSAPGLTLPATIELHDNSDISHFLAATYDHETVLNHRAQVFNEEQVKDTLTQQLQLFSARNGEQEARAIELQIRIWLISGLNNIGIITEDRKLARRVRALLERADIVIQDTAGWSLATTSSATVIERWLECIEQDFAHQPLLDLLKSPFFCDDQTREQHLNHVYRLEQDVILHEQVPSNIKRFIKALESRATRLQQPWPEDTYPVLKHLLNHLEQTAAGLQKLFRADIEHAPLTYLHALTESLGELGIQSHLENDPAGQRIINVLNQMRAGLQQANPTMTWLDFRTWLGSALEQEEFTPQNLPSAVQLMNLKQAQYCQFQALIIAGANKDSLPGTASQTPFFNQSVRQSLGLKSWPEEKAYNFYRFRCLLESANQVLITYKSEQNGEWLAPSPWVTSLANFADRALKLNLQADSLGHLLAAHSGLTESDASKTPEQQTQPFPVLDQNLIPDSFSASSHKKLIDCPYQFLASYGLALKPSESITEELMKSDYGEKVHLILRAFHESVPGLMKPMSHQLDTANRQQAIDHMIALSQQVFEKDLEDTVQHRGWLKRWLKTIPDYIDWQIQHQQNWSIYQLEQHQEALLNSQLRIHGRLDRVDQQPGTKHYSIIDYKTGKAPTQKDIDTGEDIQLISYASLLKPVSRVEYLSLDNGRVKTESFLEDEKLDNLKTQGQKRLTDLVEAMHQGTPLPAWGDQKTCQYCTMQGLCRKQIWESA